MTQHNGFGIGPVAAGIEHAELASRVAISAEGYASGRRIVAESLDNWYARQAQTLRDQDVLPGPAGLGRVRRIVRSLRDWLVVGAGEVGEADGAAQTMDGHPALAFNQNSSRTADRVTFAIIALAVIMAMRFL